jgi:tetratricopeptide (TPR) repeat protein
VTNRLSCSLAASIFVVLALTLSATTAAAQSASNKLVEANTLIRANKFAEAKTALQSYLSSHPGDHDAEVLLGVADANLDDAQGAVAAFDAAGSIPDQFKEIAAKAYADAALDALKARANEQAIALASKSLALQQSVNTLFIRGTAYANAQKYAQAITDLESARTQATDGHADAATLNAIDASLATSYLFGGQTDKGLTLARALKQRDPSNTRVDDSLAAHYNQQAIAALQAGKIDEAVADLETAAKEVPTRAALLYVQAANVLAQGSHPDWKRVQAEAEKALAVSPNDPRANYVVGIALGNQGDKSGAIPYLRKAKANAGSDAALNADIDEALKQLGQP